MLNYPTIENNIPKDKNIYSSSLEDFANVDNKLAAANSAIGESSNLAQLALTYTYNFDNKEYLDAVCILSVLAQASIDSAKRAFDIDINKEIARLKQLLNVKKNGLPYFWFFIKRKGRFAKVTKESNRKMKDLNPSLVCPMNYICDIQFTRYRPSRKKIPVGEFFQKFPLEKSRRQSKKVEALIEKYSLGLYKIRTEDQDGFRQFEEEFEDLIAELRQVYLSNEYRGLMSWLIDRTFGITPQMRANDETRQSALYKNRPTLLKTLYMVNKDALLDCFSGRLKTEHLTTVNSE